VKVKIIRSKNRFFIEIPFDIAKELKNAEIFKLKKGYYLIASINKFDTEFKDESKEELIKKHFDLLWEVSILPYQKRTINYIRKVLGEKQARTLYMLRDKGILRIWKKGKMEKIGFPNELYKKLKERTFENPNVDISKGYIIVDQNSLNKLIKKEPKLTKFIVVSSFEGKVYMIDKNLFTKLSPKVIKLLKKGAMHVEEVASALNIDEGLANVVLRVLAEKGELVEIKKGVFELV